MKIGKLIQLPAGTAIYGLRFEAENFRGFKRSVGPPTGLTQKKSEIGVTLDEEGWDPTIQKNIRYTYHNEKDFRELMSRGELKSTIHSSILYPSWNRSDIDRNFRTIQRELYFKDKADVFEPNRFVGIIMGETIVGTNLFSMFEITEQAPMHSAKEQVQEFEVFTRMLIGDKVVWLRLWNYIAKNNRAINLEEVFLRIKA